MHRLVPVVLCALLGAGLFTGPAASAESAVAPAAEPAADASSFTSLAPVRVLDTRDGTGVSGAVGPGGTITLSLSARVPADATAVVLNVTGVTPTAPTHVTVFPAGTPRPTSSNLNLPTGDIRANQVTTALGTNRSVSFFNNAGNIHLVADLAGYYSTGDGAKFTPVPPKRTLDTRLTGGPLGAGTTRVVDLAGSIPASATAVTVNLTATNATASTFVTAWPTGAAKPNASSLNLPAGDTRPNLVTVAVADRKVSLNNLAGSVDLIVDVTGFYTDDYGSLFQPLQPQRVLDTRFGTGTDGSTAPVGPGDGLILDLVGELPAISTGVALNLTGVDATTSTVVTAWAPVGEVPVSSTLNLGPGQAVPNAAVVAFAGDPAVALHNLSGYVHLVADLSGVFVTPDNKCTTDCVYGWGSSTGYAGSSPRPIEVAALPGARAVASTGETTYVLGADGRVQAWGGNLYGQLGNGWTTGQPYGGSAMPVPVVGLTNVTAIAARGQGAYALRADGTVWAWGANHLGQLGNGNVNASSVPVRVSGLTGVTAIGAGDNNGYAVRSDGTLWSWGDNGGGHLGNGSNVPYSTTPVQVTGLTDMVAVAGGGHSNGTYALREDGTVWSWGYNFSGALGHGQPCAEGVPCLSRVPVQVSGLTGVTAVASGVYNGMALREDGTVWTWGTNDRGQLGSGVDCDYTQDPSTCQAYVPVRVANLSTVTQIGGFYGGGYALLADGTVQSWGTNYSGTLGNDTVAEYTTVPVPVLDLAGVTDLGNSVSGGFAVAR
ncbi:hypothetical protein [Actinophytocola sp.]|uniref:hypothetical protein n=1 Tax=Actinophytocola sp. TaxID=1872138 RepID=UPI002ED45AC5